MKYRTECTYKKKFKIITKNNLLKFFYIYNNKDGAK